MNKEVRKKKRQESSIKGTLITGISQTIMIKIWTFGGPVMLRNNRMETTRKSKANKEHWKSE